MWLGRGDKQAHLGSKECTLQGGVGGNILYYEVAFSPLGKISLTLHFYGSGVGGQSLAT